MSGDVIPLDPIAAGLSQGIFFAQAFGSDSAADAAVAFAWAVVTVVSAPGGSA